jgi:hypothetical protein
LTATARGEPVHVYACSCLECQRGSGSAFSYGAIYPQEAVTVAGNSTLYSRRSDAGRRIESWFCPVCGVTVYFRAEAMPGMVGIAAGCFADPDFPKPKLLFWASRRHRWLELPEDITLLDTQ